MSEGRFDDARAVMAVLEKRTKARLKEAAKLALISDAAAKKKRA